MPVRQAIVGALVGRQTVAVHLRQKAQIVRQGEVPHAQRHVERQCPLAGFEREPALVHAGLVVVRHVNLGVEAAALLAGDALASAG